MSLVAETQSNAVDCCNASANEAEVVTDFYGVYLLYCINPQYLGRTYVGYTRDPTRRITQHNRGTWAGGAHRTSNRGPWKMVMIIHGFPNNIAALRFEWAWQHPEQSTRLQHVVHPRRVARKEKELGYRLRILSEMLRSGPWHRLPLTVRWLHDEYYQPFPDCMRNAQERSAVHYAENSPPAHMIIKHGPVKSKNISKKAKKTQDTFQKPQHMCSMCYRTIEAVNSKLKCLNSSCSLHFHLNCLANVFLTDGEYVPIDGRCPKCRTKMTWGDLIRNMKCGNDVRNSFNDDNSGPDDDDLDLSQRQELGQKYVSVASSDDDL